MTRRSTLRADRGALSDTMLSLQTSGRTGKPPPTHQRGERTHQCPICPRILRGEQGLRHHLIQFHGDEPPMHDW